MTSRSFHLDTSAGKIMGVCAGIADHSGVDVLLVRIGLVLLTLTLFGQWAVLAYLVVGLVAPKRRDS